MHCSRFSILILIISFANGINSVRYSVHKNVDLNDDVKTANQVKVFEILSKFSCLTECNRNVACKSAVLLQSESRISICYLYNVAVLDNGVSSGSSSAYSKHIESSITVASSSSFASTSTSSTSINSIVINASDNSPVTDSLIIDTTKSASTSSATTIMTMFPNIYISAPISVSTTVSRKSINQICRTSIECNTDIGLTCQNGQCKCSNSGPWITSKNSCFCVTPWTYIAPKYCYYTDYASSYTWTDADSVCRSMNSTLLNIDDLNESVYVLLLADYQDKWIGARQISSKYVWSNLNATTVATTLWKTAEPKRAFDCTYICTSDVKICTRNCSNQRGFLCEKV